MIMWENLRMYLTMASGLTDVTTAKAKDVARGLVQQGLSVMQGADTSVVGSVQEIAEDLVSTSKANRELLTTLIRSEVDKAVARMGFVREDELAAMRKRVKDLEAQVAALSTATSTASSTGTPAKKKAAASSAKDSSAPKKRKKVVKES